MEYVTIPGTNMRASRVSLGTWAIGGWMWGGTDDEQSIRTIREAVNKGVNLVDTAPVYGMGHSEKIVGKALADHDDVLIATKAGIEWDENGVYRNASRERIHAEIKDSLERLGRDHIDIYYVHWPDPLVSMEETAGAMKELYDAGTVRAVGVSNFSVEQMEEFMKHCPIHCLQPPYNIFEREIEDAIMPFCRENNIMLMTYGAICRGLLTGKMRKEDGFTGDDLRNVDPKFREPHFSQYLDAVEKMRGLTGERTLTQLAVRWVLDQHDGIAIWGARRPEQTEDIPGVMGWQLDEDTKEQIEKILGEITDPVGPEFMAPPTRDGQ